MPKISHVSLKGRVRDRLHSAVADLLPEEFRNDPVVKWVVSHDSLYRAKTDGDYNRNAPWMEDIAESIASEVQPKISFYFGSLFHIARMRSVSFYCKQNVNLLNSEDNLERSAANIANQQIEISKFSGVIAQDSATALLQSLSRVARENASQQEQLATYWWKIWLVEAGALRKATQNFDESWLSGDMQRLMPNRNLFRSIVDLLGVFNERSQLLESMKREGVRFRDTY